MQLCAQVNSDTCTNRGSSRLVLYKVWKVKGTVHVCLGAVSTIVLLFKPRINNVWVKVFCDWLNERKYMYKARAGWETAKNKNTICVGSTGFYTLVFVFVACKKANLLTQTTGHYWEQVVNCSTLTWEIVKVVFLAYAVDTQVKMLVGRLYLACRKGLEKCGQFTSVTSCCCFRAKLILGFFYHVLFKYFCTVQIITTCWCWYFHGVSYMNCERTFETIYSLYNTQTVYELYCYNWIY